MRLNKKILIFLFGSAILTAQGQININSDSVSIKKNTNYLLVIPENRIKAAGSAIATNMAVWSFDRFITNEPYARINFNTIKNNFKTGFVWDNDKFITNLFAHPYHGGLYFNSARSNGMSFWQSAPFAAGGSLMWEYFMEKEPPSINDFLATSLGGLCLGEMTFRISDDIIDNRTRGLNRIARETLITVISPIRGINRLLSGEAWKYSRNKGSTLPPAPITYYSTFGHRLMTDNIKNKEDGSNMLCFDFGMYYGNPYNHENKKPYDFFFLKIEGNLFSIQPIISRVSALGRIYSRNVTLKKPDLQFAWGLFQHFNFYESKSDINNVSLSPYKISEAASVGPGLLYKTRFNGFLTFSSSAYLSAILLGGSQTDHYRYYERDYNLGSGFSSKINFDLQFGNNAKIYLNAEDYRIYSWVGYDPSDTDNINSNVQGDVGNASLSVANIGFNYIVNKHIFLEAEASYYYRESIYKYYPNIEHTVTENKVSVGYIF
jgi:hypothetical protein